jgi:hypothetical protein
VHSDTGSKAHPSGTSSAQTLRVTGSVARDCTTAQPHSSKLTQAAKVCACADSKSVSKRVEVQHGLKHEAIARCKYMDSISTGIEIDVYTGSLSKADTRYWAEQQCKDHLSKQHCLCCRRMCCRRLLLS